MQFSSGPYYTAMDREYAEPSTSEVAVSKPIVPINELGVTVVEKDPVTGGGLIQNIDANIRMGASKMQLVMNTPHTSALGGRPKAYGKEVRENIRELIRANNVSIEGLEMPTSSMSNLSGFDPQRFNISEQKRLQDLQEVKDAIKFIGDIAGGGGVDIWSQEFYRNVADSPWNMKGKHAGKFELYKGEEQYATEYLVDQRTGHVMSEIKHSSDIFEPEYRKAEKSFMGKDRTGKDVQIRAGDWIDMDGNWINPNVPEELLHRVPEWDEVNKKFKSRPVEWKEIVQRTAEHNERWNHQLDPAEYAFRLQLENKWIQARGSSLFYTREYQDEVKRRDAMKKSLKYYEEMEKSVPEDEVYKIMHEDPIFRGEFLPKEFRKPSEIIKHQLDQMEHHLKHVHEASAAADSQAAEVAKTMNEVVSLKKFAKSKAIESYAELGIAALDETRTRKDIDRPIHVGPELGWPTAYGGHPEEFIELIKESRKQMAERLVKDRGYSKDEAKDYSEKHIKGCFDTSHLGMWLDHFKKEHPQESEEEKLKRFKGWYMDMVKKMQDEGVIGSIQAVDSASGAHGHLPAGQGILPVVEAVDYLRSHGFQGFIVSEGHEEEQFGRGRILLQTWRAFGADISDSYFAAARQKWNDVSESYFGHVNPPPYVLGAYRPSDDWVFWSGVPLE
jgi:hypothetical protein